MGHGEQPEAWHCVAGLGSLKIAQERLLVEVQLSCSKRPQCLAVYNRICQYHRMTTKNSSGRGVDQPELRVIQRVELEK